MGEAGPDRDPLDLLTEEILERIGSGDRPSAEELLDSYPEFADDIPALLKTLDELERLFPRTPPVDGADTAGFRLGPAAEMGATASASGPKFWQVGDYHLLREVGRGGMGIVFEAEQISLNRRVALKVLPSHIVFDRAVLERFRREARAAARLHHSNIVPIFEVGQDGEQAYYAMQFIRGRGLDRVIGELRRLRQRQQEPHPGGETSVWEHSQFSIAGPASPGSVPTDADGEGSASGPGPHSDAAREAEGLSQAARSLWTGSFGSEPPGPQTSVFAIASTDATLIEPWEGPSGLMSAAVPTAPGSLAGAGLQDEDGAEAGRAVIPRFRSSGWEPYFRSVARLGRQVAEALAYAHGRGIVHRDIKPSNLLLDADGVVWVTDFGLAQVEHDRTLTRTGDLLGTLRYMAPECFRNRADARSDLYALGLTLYELLTLRPAFESADRLELIEQIRTREPRPARSIDAGIPRDLETIVRKATDKDPGGRYQTAQALAEDLGRFLEDRPILARPIGPAERLARWCRRRPDQAALTGAIFGLLLAIAVVSSSLAVRLDLKAREAQASAEEAHQAAGRAMVARLEADRANDELSAARDSLRRNLYAARVNAALSAWYANDMGRFRVLLEQARPAEEDRDLLGWEWDYLRRLSGPGQVVLKDHGREIGQVAFSPDGRTIASIQWGGRARLWDARTGRPRRTFPGSDDPGITGPLSYGVFGVAFSPDGRTIAAQAPEGLFPAFFDADSGELLAECEPVDGSVTSQAISPDGRWLAGALSTHRLVLWDAATGRLLDRVDHAHHAPVLALAFSPDGRTIVTGGVDGVVRLWDVGPLRRRASLAGHAGAVFAVAFSPDGRTIASVGRDGSIRLWDADRAEERAVLKEAGPILHTVAISPDGRTLAEGGIEPVVTLRDLGTGEPIRYLQGHTNRVVSLGFSPDGRHLASGSFDRTVRLWELDRPPQPRTLPNAESLPNPELLGSLDRPIDLAFSADSRIVAASYANGYLKGWRVEEEALAWAASILAPGDTRPDRDINALAFSPDGREVATDAPGDSIVFYDLETGLVRVGIAAAHSGIIKDLAYSPDGSRLASASSDGTLRVWDLEAGALVFSYEGQPRGVRALEYTPDGSRIVSAGVNGTVKILDASAGEELDTLLADDRSAYCVAVHPDGRTLVSAGSDAVIRVWDLESGRPLAELSGHLGSVDDLAIHPDGRRLASAGADRTIRLWDLTSGLELLTLKDHDDRVRRVAFSPDGRHLASVSDDLTVKIRVALPIDPEVLDP